MQATKLLNAMQENRIIENYPQLHTVILVICRPANIVRPTYLLTYLIKTKA